MTLVSRRNFLKMLGLGAVAASGSTLEVFAGNPCYRKRNREIYSRNDPASSQWCYQRLRNGRVVYYHVYTPAHAPQYHTEREETPPEPPSTSRLHYKSSKRNEKK